MTLADAIRSISSSRMNDACKRIAMGGYFYRSAVSTEVGSEGNFTLTFRKRDNDGNDQPVEYQYSYTALTDKWAAVSAEPDFTGELLGELLANDWIVGTKDAFEAARMPEPDDEW